MKDDGLRHTSASIEPLAMKQLQLDAPQSARPRCDSDHHQHPHTQGPIISGQDRKAQAEERRKQFNAVCAAEVDAYSTYCRLKRVQKKSRCSTSGHSKNDWLAGIVPSELRKCSWRHLTKDQVGLIMMAYVSVLVEIVELASTLVADEAGMLMVTVVYIFWFVYSLVTTIDWLTLPSGERPTIIYPLGNLGAICGYPLWSLWALSLRFSVGTSEMECSLYLAGFIFLLYGGLLILLESEIEFLPPWWRPHNYPTIARILLFTGIVSMSVNALIFNLDDQGLMNDPTVPMVGQPLSWLIGFLAALQALTATLFLATDARSLFDPGVACHRTALPIAQHQHWDDLSFTVSVRAVMAVQRWWRKTRDRLEREYLEGKRPHPPTRSSSILSPRTPAAGFGKRLSRDLTEPLLDTVDEGR
ncbi:unnamed protein product [Vitrella brassicaformis CCMP3155]|uniref:Uncharacterized protein n=1 Tax=Vitrella brassicaformis (strain CCMP3155) TaxID=1169540 RepID=A0A0G4EN29_VITBC|nr:unnamed protein product [Vitrella brassicaformis CCMP3155]|mmetsp:Transcript_45327/g.127953  ORF Transcript_45327/g.127953 Transcript_45327/m.127953 type:complete len:415 (-) Transcript_45327:256-1500(-)|eukprot:CEL98433.1 unnamed protein product [Vitrella brassicaformis CCMP3155]